MSITQNKKDILSKETKYLNKEMPSLPFSFSPLPLVRRDILHYEETLCQDIARFVQFTAYLLYFPTQDELPQINYLKEEAKLLIPLRREGKLLAILLLREVKIEESVLTFLPHLVEICLEKIYFEKSCGLDPRSHLIHRTNFFNRIENEVEAVRHYFAHAFSHGLTSKNIIRSEQSSKHENSFLQKEFQSQEEHNSPQQSSVGLLAFSLVGIETIRSYLGYACAEKILISLAHAIKELAPEGVECSLIDDKTIGILYPGATRPMLETFGRNCVVLEKSVKHSVFGQMTAKLCAGYALFPQDWDGSSDSREAEEVSHLLINKAQTAAERLKKFPSSQEKNKYLKQERFHGAGAVLAYKDILLLGGHIKSILPYSQVVIDLGRSNDVREGMCFSVWSNAEHSQYKGEIIVKRVKENSAEADISILHDSSNIFARGDYLQYNSHGDFYSQTLDEENKRSIYGYREFRDNINLILSENSIEKFSLVLLRFNVDQNKHNEESTKAKVFECLQSLDTFMLKKTHSNKDFSIPLMGSMSLNSIFIFHAHMSKEICTDLYKKISNYLYAECGVQTAVGIANYPYLTCRPAEMWEGCRKALDCALLLPSPQIACFDSLSMNISADKKFSQGDFFGAVDEYRMALLADSENSLAWNSLGVSLAELSRHVEARYAFEEAYKCQPDDTTICYNLGTANLSLGDKAKAREFFKACLSQESSHLFARIRLGELAEKENNLDLATEHYQKALEDNEHSCVPYRHLAKVFIIQNKKELAREYLQKALHRNSYDAVSLQLLAGLYLDGGEDAQLAEVLARQSVTLASWRRSSWIELARALEAQGRYSEATEVRRNSMRF